MSASSRLRRALPAPALSFAQTVQRELTVRRLVGPVFETRGEVYELEHELATSGLPEHLDEARARFGGYRVQRTARGRHAGIGALSAGASSLLYALVRKTRPSVLVETGVCNGFSTAVLLLALDRNGTGHLTSIDLPERAGDDGASQDPAQFWEGKGAAAVPTGLDPGWVIPDELRSRWALELGPSTELLPKVLERLGTIDFFLHDSEHSYECMTFEYGQAYGHLRGGGVLASDDVTWNSAFDDFARTVRRPVHRLHRKVAFLLK